MDATNRPTEPLCATTPGVMAVLANALGNLAPGQQAFYVMSATQPARSVRAFTDLAAAMAESAARRSVTKDGLSDWYAYGPFTADPGSRPATADPPFRIDANHHLRIAIPICTHDGMTCEWTCSRRAFAAEAPAGEAMDPAAATQAAAAADVRPEHVALALQVRRANGLWWTYPLRDADGNRLTLDRVDALTVGDSAHRRFATAADYVRGNFDIVAAAERFKERCPGC
ncbi:MAG: hypothetical protein NW201_05905 [Gemmatimonadales bacterium]|nr:hypothetical protein [Gemmatimonadales bacterium]